MAKFFDKKGLSEQQRKELALLEKEQRESQKRLEAALPQFQKEYASLVNFHRIRHQAVIAFAEGTPEWLRKMVLGVARPGIRLIECSKEVDALNSEALQMEVNRNKAVDPND